MSEFGIFSFRGFTAHDDWELSSSSSKSSNSMLAQSTDCCTGTRKDLLTGRGMVEEMNGFTVVQFDTLEDMKLYDGLANEEGALCCASFNEHSGSFRGFTTEDGDAQLMYYQHFMKFKENWESRWNPVVLLDKSADIDAKALKLGRKRIKKPKRVNQTVLKGPLVPMPKSPWKNNVVDTLPHSGSLAGSPAKPVSCTLPNQTTSTPHQTSSPTKLNRPPRRSSRKRFRSKLLTPIGSPVSLWDEYDCQLQSEDLSNSLTGSLLLTPDSSSTSAESDSNNATIAKALLPAASKLLGKSDEFPQSDSSVVSYIVQCLQPDNCTNPSFCKAACRKFSPFHRFTVGSGTPLSSATVNFLENRGLSNIDALSAFVAASAVKTESNRPRIVLVPASEDPGRGLQQSPTCKKLSCGVKTASSNVQTQLAVQTSKDKIQVSRAPLQDRVWDDFFRLDSGIKSARSDQVKPLHRKLMKNRTAWSDLTAKTAQRVPSMFPSTIANSRTPEKPKSTLPNSNTRLAAQIRVPTNILPNSLFDPTQRSHKINSNSPNDLQRNIKHSKLGLGVNSTEPMRWELPTTPKSSTHHSDFFSHELQNQPTKKVLNTFTPSKLPQFAVMCRTIPQLGYLCVERSPDGQLLMDDLSVSAIPHKFFNICDLSNFLNRRLKNSLGFENPTVWPLDWILVTRGVLCVKNVPPSNPVVWYHSEDIKRPLKEPRDLKLGWTDNDNQIVKKLKTNCLVNERISTHCSKPKASFMPKVVLKARKTLNKSESNAAVQGREYELSKSRWISYVPAS